MRGEADEEKKLPENAARDNYHGAMWLHAAVEPRAAALGCVL